jgi:hypothetical protein
LEAYPIWPIGRLAADPIVTACNKLKTKIIFDRGYKIDIKNYKEHFLRQLK